MDDNISLLSRSILEKIDHGFKENQESFVSLRRELDKIASEVRQLTVDIVELKGNVAVVKNEAFEARSDVSKLEHKVSRLENKAKELELAVEIARTATPRHLPERVAVIESSLAGVKKLGWFVMASSTGLIIKAMWDVLTMGSGA
jgi:chromosome segregation ATPase